MRAKAQSSGARGGDRRDDAAWQPVSIETPATASESDLALLVAATDARTRAQAHYSHFQVGAALETADGVVDRRLQHRERDLRPDAVRRACRARQGALGRPLVFTRIAVVADTDAPTPPCGPCRQLLWEYCGDIDIILANLKGRQGALRLSALLPMPFDRRLLG